MARKTIFLLLLCTPIWSDDSGPDLLSAAKKGQAAEVRALLEKGAPVESRDKEGRTPLMLAAAHGHGEVVRLLLSKGAKADDRDHDGLSAYGLSLLSTAKGRDGVLSVLPAPAHIRLAIKADWIRESTNNSCFMNPQQIVERLQEIKPDALATAALRDVAAANATQFVELVAADAEADGTLTLQVRPDAMCVQQQLNDNLRLEIDVRLTRTGIEAPIWQKTFGGGLKGLKAKIATNPVQYGAVYQEWAKADSAPIYWGAIEALLKQ